MDAPGLGPWQTGRLLLATPQLDDPTFERSVILVLDHDEEGALGLVLNRASDVPVAVAAGDWAGRTSSPAVVFGGGPVEPTALVALGRLTPGAARYDAAIVDRVQLIDLDDEFDRAADELEALRLYAGYAGWAPGQLEEELFAGAWIVVDASVRDVFTDSPSTLWRDVLARQRGTLSLLASYPDDPSRN